MIEMIEEISYRLRKLCVRTFRRPPAEPAIPAAQPTPAPAAAQSVALPVVGPYPPVDVMLAHCCFCSSPKKGRKYLFISGVLPVVVCDECVTALNTQMFHIELQRRGLDDPETIQ